MLLRPVELVLIQDEHGTVLANEKLDDGSLQGEDILKVELGLICSAKMMSKTHFVEANRVGIVLQLCSACLGTDRIGGQPKIDPPQLSEIVPEENGAVVEYF